MTHGVGRAGPNLGRAQMGGRVKLIHGITLPSDNLIKKTTPYFKNVVYRNRT